MRELFRDAFYTVSVDRDGIAYVTRNDTPYTSLAEAEASLDRLSRFISQLPRALAMHALVDLRTAPGWNDEAFERKTAALRGEIVRRFSKVAILVKTHIGKLQVSRLGREDAINIEVFNSETLALGYLRRKSTAPPPRGTLASRRPLDSDPGKERHATARKVAEALSSAEHRRPTPSPFDRASDETASDEAASGSPFDGDTSVFERLREIAAGVRRRGDAALDSNAEQRKLDGPPLTATSPPDSTTVRRDGESSAPPSSGTTHAGKRDRGEVEQIPTLLQAFQNRRGHEPEDKS